MQRTDPLILAPEWSGPATVRIAQTTRLGGTSPPPYGSLNLGLHVGDDSARVRRNRALLGRALPGHPAWLRQVHGTRIVDADGAGHGTDPAEADGATTAVPHRVVGVMTADCLPLVIANGAGTRVVAVHAGWRGLAAGIVRAAVDRFAPDEALHVWLGPAIGPEAFEVGAEVREAFVRLDDRHGPAFRPARCAGKFLADLYALARHDIEACGRERASVTGGDRCTFSEAGIFYSHRRDGPRTGRMATLAWIESPAREGQASRPP